jgi:hypothetical protein
MTDITQNNFLPLTNRYIIGQQHTALKTQLGQKMLTQIVAA